MSKQQTLTADDLNELLNEIHTFRSECDNLSEGSPGIGLIDKLQEMRDKLENVRLNNAGLFTELISLFLAHFLLECGSNNAYFIGDIVWSTSSDQRQEARNRRPWISRNTRVSSD
jgi:hypothetical protein